MTNEVTLFLQPWKKKYGVLKNLTANSGTQYVIEDRLGSGGNAAVHKCYEKFSGDEFAIKFLINDSVKRKTRFQREAGFLKTCKHQHIVEYIDDGSVQSHWKKTNKRKYPKNISFIIMELSEDGDLSKFISKKYPIKPEIYTAQFRGLCGGLAFMHKNDVLHRDIKPENILIIGDRWVLSDFGLAADTNKAGRLDITGDKEKVGPMFWMSPEATNKCLGSIPKYSKINKSSDIFQLASVFWFIVNKRHPSGILKEKDWRGKMEIYKVMKKALQHNPNERYLDGSRFENALVDAIEQN